MVLRSFVALLCSLLVCACTPGVSVDVRQSPPMAETARAMPVASTLPAVTLGAAAAAPADLQGPFEPSPRLPSAEMLPDYPLTGPRYRIADEAQVVDYFGQFELRADVGGLVADGAEVLKLRVRELAAVRELDRISTSEVFVEAMKRTGQRPITAVRQVATEPAATVSGLPAGVGRFLVRTARNIRDLALDLNDAARDAMADEDEEGDVDAKGDGEANDQDQAEFRLKAEKVATSAALRYIGYSKARREIARHVGADPYSTNPLLRERLDRLAWAAWTGSKITGYALGLIGGVAADAIGYAKDAYELVWELPPEDLKRRNLEILDSLGISGKPARDLIRRSKAFTLTQQTEFVELLRSPLFAPARNGLFELALQAEREVHARFLIDALRLLRLVDAPSATATVLGASPALLRPNGSYIIALPVDYLHWTAEIAAFAWRDDLIGRPNLLLVTGTLSPKALDAFSMAGWTVRERVDVLAELPQVHSTQTAPLR